MVTIIATIIVSILFGVAAPIATPGLNFSQNFSKNLFSQVTSTFPKKNFSEINPMDSLNRVTKPLDDINETVGKRFSLIDLDALKGLINNLGLNKASNLPLEGRLALKDTNGTSGLFGILKSAF